MKSLSQSLIVLISSTLVSGCMCMMPMEKMDMEKDKMGQMDMGDKGRSHEMAGTKIETTKDEKRMGDLIVAFSTIPAKPTVGENVLRVKLTDASGGTVRDAVVTFDVTMTMPGMTVMEEKAAVTKDVYQANTNFGTAGEWQITVKIQRAGEAERREHFTATVT